MEFPKAKYHATEPVRQVNDSDEESALGAGWFDNPNLCVEPSLAESLDNVYVNALAQFEADPAIDEVLAAPRRRARPPRVTE